MQPTPEANEITREPGTVAKVAASAVLLGVLGCVLVQVFSRYSIQLKTSWTEELARFSLFAIAGVGGALALSSSAHFRMTILVGLLPMRGRLIVEIIARLATLAFLVTLAYAGVLYAISMADSTSPMLRISYAIPYSIIPIAAIVMAATAVAQLWRRLVVLRSGEV